jgi:signal transduction histidine kinase
VATTKTREGSGGWVHQIAERPLSSLRFARSRSDALIAGVAGGLAERWAVDPMLVRISFVLLAFSGAVGVVAYIVAWSVSLDPGDRRAPKPREPVLQQSIALGCMVLGSVLILRSAGLWLGDQFGIPLIVASAGAAVVNMGTGPERRLRFARMSSTRGRPSIVNLLIGALLVVAGVAWFLTKTNRSFNGLVAVFIAVAVTTVGLVIVFGPWVYRMTNQLGDERRDRIRSEERADLAAHLHDSVLQTLALIQRNASSPRKMASLARRQERELRSWLYGHPSAGADKLDAAVHQMADDIEETHDVTVETVIVGDCDLNERTRAIIAACREAATNAAIHSGTNEVSVYIECEPEQITAFVRDRGNGFDPAADTNGRRGIADSIRGRIERNGGSVTITSAPGEGCEVQLTMPR